MSLKKHYFVQTVSPELYREALALIQEIETDAIPAKQSARLGMVLRGVVDSALHQFFEQPFEEIKLHKAARKSADAGMATARKGAHALINKMFKSLTSLQLMNFASYIKERMFVIEGEEKVTHHFGFEIEPDLYGQLEAIFERIENDEDTHRYEAEVAEILIKVTDVGIDNYYHESVTIAGIKGFTRKAGDIAVGAIQKALHVVVRQVFKKTRHKEMKTFAEMFRTLIIEWNDEDFKFGHQHA